MQTNRSCMLHIHQMSNSVKFKWVIHQYTSCVLWPGNHNTIYLMVTPFQTYLVSTSFTNYLSDWIISLLVSSRRFKLFIESPNRFNRKITNHIWILTVNVYCRIQIIKFKLNEFYFFFRFFFFCISCLNK